MSVENSSWAIERDYPHPPERVFNAWADPSVKVRWFDLSGNNNPDYHGDFRVGGTESQRTSVSLATIELKGTPAGTRLVYTEQGAYLDGLDNPDSRRTGTNSQLDNLATILKEQA